ncbi:gastrula zinc finger protein XlCGF8.2DB-like [Sitophilus oryzae]|uniref:Gastrula zinc finger protein XlCGF8.2DB-like n=1 Tax=Sitophilus oryzae TaxID=7048 RepID=A0A6J2YP46_SITOR|nr:gastrula zinc finger protein XlCGF8.2DB-like [Sitophilus oryzae]
MGVKIQGRDTRASLVTTRGVRCDCGKKFKNFRYKKLHRMKGCGNPPTFYCPYDDCGYKFTESMFLGFHLTGFHLKLVASTSQRSAKKGEVFTCKSCDKTFKHRSSHYNHTQYTCGKGPSYFCNMCDFRTKYVYHVQQHLYVRHDVTVRRKDLKDCVGCTIVKN